MGRILRVDPLGGASGDMFLAALVDLGADIDHIKSSLASLDFDEDFRFLVEETVNRGFAGIRLRVEVLEKEKWVAPESQGAHSEENHHHDHRHLSDIRSLIAESSLPEKVKEMAMAVFDTLAKSEAKVHGKEAENVHFHEVGAVDSIVDIVGSCLALDHLDIDHLYLTPIGVAKGSVKCAHGLLPLPAPATQLILEECPLVFHPEKSELCTPTGAALLKTLGRFEPPEGVWVSKGVGMGLSHRTPEVAPPFLRMTILENNKRAEEKDFLADTVIRCSFDIDDMSAEYLAPVLSNIMDLGALDVSSSPLNMKKGRLGSEVRVLCREELKERVLEIILKHTSTFGVRVEKVERVVLPREIIEIQTPWGKVRVKQSCSKRFPKEHIEMEDVVALAEKEGLRVDEILNKVRQVMKE